MSEYDNKIFEFFSGEENFRNMYKIVGYFDSVKTRLLDEFWQLVKNNIDTLNQQNGGKWVLQLTGKVTGEDSKLMLFKKHWPHSKGIPIVAIAYSRMAVQNWPFYGLFLNRDLQGFDHNKLWESISSLPAAIGFDNDGNEKWPFWKDAGIDFSEIEDYTRICRDGRNVLASDFAGSLFQLATDIESNLEETIICNKIV